MKLTNNNFGGIKEIKSFSQEELSDVKRKLSKLIEDKTDQDQIDDFIRIRFLSQEILEQYSNYISEIEQFNAEYLTKNNPNIIKTAIAREIKLFSNNLLNTSQNSRNTKRFFKNKVLLDDITSSLPQLIEKSSELSSKIEKSIKTELKTYEDEVYLWIKINRIKNSTYKFTDLPQKLKIWEEINELITFITNLNKEKDSKKKKKMSLAFHIDDLSNIINDKYGKNAGFYLNLLYIFFSNNLLEYVEEKPGDLENQEGIMKDLKEFVKPLMKEMIINMITDITDEIKELGVRFDVSDEEKEVDIESLLEKKISIFLPKIVGYYFNVLEKKYQSVINDVTEIDEFNNIVNSYSTKITIFLTIIENIEQEITKIERYLIPHENIMMPLKKIFTNLVSEIDRRKMEYENYLLTVKKERLRDNINSFVAKKINELNDYINKYEDETSMMIREEFPQLKRIKVILKEYKQNVQKIKDEVFKKIDSSISKDVDVYHIIKNWEDNFISKKQQLSFLLSLMLNKIFKSFKGLIEEEEHLFDTISEISVQSEESIDIPLNFAISHVLAEKMAEDELKERIIELKAKINKNEKINVLYNEELLKLEDIVSSRVKSREGITAESVQCAVCHKFIDFGKDNIIKCPFCESAYHYLCVAFWLSKYNSCPTCQNVFLDPNSNLFDSSESESE